MSLKGTWRWYITIAAIRQWMDLTGRTGALEEDNPAFLAAERELGDLSLTAKLAVEASERQRSGASIYRGTAQVNGRSVRAECTVMPPLRGEGKLPQLVRVTSKDHSSSRARERNREQSRKNWDRKHPPSAG